MKQIKVLIIEDELPVIDKLRKQLQPITSDINPLFFDSEVEFLGDYNNQRDLQIMYRKPDYFEKFKEIISKLIDIDLFIIDISLESNQRDEKGLAIIHHLVENIDLYNKGRSKIIVLSRWGDSSKMKQKFDESKVTYISKDGNADYAIVVRNFARKNFEHLEDHNTLAIETLTDDPQPSINTDNKKYTWIKKIINKIKHLSGGEVRVWFDENFFHPANYYFDKFIIFVFGVLLIGALVFALKGITRDFYEYFSMQSDSTKAIETKYNPVKNKSSLDYQKKTTKIPESNEANYRLIVDDTTLIDTIKKPDQATSYSNKKGASENKIKILEVVENIFIYLLPLFILLGFYNFYSSTTAVRWRGDSRTAIDFDSSIKGINTSKIILLSSLLSYTLINAIDRFFVNKDSKIEDKTLIAYGVFIIILMAFILLISKENKGSNEKSGKQSDGS